MPQIRMNIQLFGRVKKEGAWYISHCPPLDVYSQGETEKKAIQNLIEATSLFLISCFERGVLDEALKQCGFKARRTEPAGKKAKAPRGMFEMDVPVPFYLDERKQRAACRA